MTDGDRTAIDRLRSAVRRLRRWLFGRGDGPARGGGGTHVSSQDGADPRAGALEQRSQQKMDRLVELAEEKGEESDEGSSTEGAAGSKRPDE